MHRFGCPRPAAGARGVRHGLAGDHQATFTGLGDEFPARHADEGDAMPSIHSTLTPASSPATWPFRTSPTPPKAATPSSG